MGRLTALAFVRRIGNYDTLIAPVERAFLGPTRPWVCGRAVGDVLEIAAGTGSNLAYYPTDVHLTLTELRPTSLELAERKAEILDIPATFAVADAMSLPFDDASFDSVVCTYALCGVPDERGALVEMLRVLRPGGRLLLADHVEASAGWVRVLQRALEAITSRTNGEYWTRRPRIALEVMGVEIVATTRTHLGVLERVYARKA